MRELFRNIKKPLILLILSVSLFLVLFVANKYKNTFVYTSVNKNKVENVLKQKEETLNSIILKYSKLLTNTSSDSLFLKSDSLFKLLENNNLAILIYKNDSLVLWSNKDFTNEEFFSKSYYGNWALKNYNSFIISRLTEIDNYKIVGIIPIKKEYPFENQFLKSSFYSEFHIPNNFDTSIDDTFDNIRINDKDNKYVFSLVKKYDKISKTLYLLYLLMYFAFIILLIISISSILKAVIKSQIWVIIAGVFFLFFRLILMHYKFPEFIYTNDLFSPFYYAESWFLPSLGDLLISSYFILHFSYLIYKHQSIKLKKETISKITIIVMFLISTYIAFYTIIIFLIKSAVNNSNIPLDIYNLTNLNYNTLIIFISISMLLFALIISTKKLTLLVNSVISIKKMIVFFILIAIIQLVITDLLWLEFKIESFIFILIIFSISTYSTYKKLENNQTIILFVILITSLFTGIFTTKLNSEKELKIRKMYAIGISSERDYVAETLFPSLEKELSKDTILHALVQDPIRNTEIIYQQIIKNYFHGYWSKYEPNITICGTFKEFEEDNKLCNCNDYFNKKLIEYGTNLEDTKFKFLDDLDGKISYIGALEYTMPDDSNQVTIFIELNSKLKSDKLGYPKLLLASHDKDNLFHKSYSYAKYKNNVLVLQHGNYQYKLNLKSLNNSKKEFFIYDENNFSHIVYKNGNNTFVVSLPLISFLDYLAIYSYLFVFFFILASIGLVFTNRRLRINLFSYNLKSKIQYSMIGILILSLVTIGVGTILLNINETEKAYKNEIGEKTQSILVELQHKFGNYDKLLDEDKPYLKYLFEKWSYVFFTDINLYSTSGDLITSSRMDIFNKNLTGRKMDRNAYVKIKLKDNSEFIHKERIGKLSYMSAYIPFMNENNEVLAYINLPYFTKQNRISNEISKLIVTLLNIYVLLFIITVFVAVIVAQNITRPLFLIQKHIGQINLLKNITPISYNKQDEIGALVNEYNKVIAELEKSATLLAKSERESAWREMAKQIAHEIKNPLTPMKLNIQFLQKSWKDKDEDFNDKLDRISISLIEQIDSLSRIAGDFSDFANITKQNIEEIALIPRIENTVHFFEQSENINITINNKSKTNVVIFADKEQITQVFNNLIKNAIQEIGTDKQAVITINISENDKVYIIEVKDNGNGIPEDIQDKLFIPNFTTKSSGMGLGLAIVKKIIETSQGKIYFKTQQSVGTSFFIEFPKREKSN